ncbi:MAG: GreA/GreB family elongation factor [Tissierellia bacterium]|nr:GreA/GreB family elongation factor [Tissierellia bacterium]
MGIGHLQGSPWHVEFAKVEHEGRRHKSRCIYYRHRDLCGYGDAIYCCGSGQCDVYVEGNRPIKKRAPSPWVQPPKKKKPIRTLPLGSKFRARDVNSGQTLLFEIVAREDEDFIACKITQKSPLALEVAKSKVGETIEVNEFAQYHILSIDRGRG